MIIIYNCCHVFVLAGSASLQQKQFLRQQWALSQGWTMSRAPPHPSLFQGHWFLFLNCPLSFNIWNKTLPIFHLECMIWLLKLGRVLNDCCGGQGKFKVKIKLCAALQTQLCLLFTLRAILSQRKTQNWEYILKGKLENVREQTYNSSRVSISFCLDVIVQEGVPGWLRKRDGSDAITRKVMKNATQSTLHTTANRASLHKTVVKS